MSALQQTCRRRSGCCIPCREQAVCRLVHLASRSARPSSMLRCPARSVVGRLPYQHDSGAPRCSAATTRATSSFLRATCRGFLGHPACLNPAVLALQAERANSRTSPAEASTAPLTWNSFAKAFISASHEPPVASQAACVVTVGRVANAVFCLKRHSFKSVASARAG